MSRAENEVLRRKGAASLGRATIADDLLRGADAIALFMFGDRKMRRQVYHLAQAGQLPVFRLGAILCARRSTLLAWIEAQEAR